MGFNAFPEEIYATYLLDSNAASTNILIPTGYAIRLYLSSDTTYSGMIRIWDYDTQSYSTRVNVKGVGTYHNTGNIIVPVQVYTYNDAFGFAMIYRIY